MLTLVIIIISLFFPSSSIDVQLNSDPRVRGLCRRPHVPHGSKLTVDKYQYIENETARFSCGAYSIDGYGIVGQYQTCRHVTWQGEQARCGKVINSPLIRFEAFKCDNPSEPFMTEVVTQTVPPRPMPYSFYHKRLPKTLKLYSNGSNCYRWRLKLEKPVEIAILSVGVNTDRMNNTLVKPNVTAQIAHRTCRVRYFDHNFVDGRDFFFIDYYCYLYSNLTDLNTVDLDTLETDTIELKVEWPTNQKIRFESLIFAETAKIDAQTEKRTPNCGKPEITRIGVIERLGSKYSYFSCDSSMVDVTPNSSLLSSRGEYRQTCNANGEWTGAYPQCVPKQTCSKEEITAKIDDSVEIKAVGDVYYTNNTHWEAIQGTWVEYVCSHPEAFFLGLQWRHCFKGTWTNSVPKCIQDQNVPSSSNLSMTFILAIVSVITIIVVLIVYLGLRYNKRQFKQKFKTAKEEIEQTVLNETVLGDYYSDPEAYEEQLGGDFVGEDYLEIHGTMPAYKDKYVSMAEGVSPRDMNYTNMSLKIKQSSCETSNALMYD